MSKTCVTCSGQYATNEEGVLVHDECHDLTGSGQPRTSIHTRCRLPHRHLRLDISLPERPRHRDAMVAVADEVHVTDPHHLNGRQGLAGEGRRRHAYPALARVRLQRAEVGVEITGPVLAAANVVQRDGARPSGRTLAGRSAARVSNARHRRRTAARSSLSQLRVRARVYRVSAVSRATAGFTCGNVTSNMGLAGESL